METITVCPTSTATILACQKIARTFKENIYELSSLRADWDPGFATSLNVWIDDTIDKYYADSLDSIDDERFRNWHEIMVEGLQHLKVLRASLKVDFKENSEFLRHFFEVTGYTEYFSDAKNGDHFSLYKFLKTFALNLEESQRRRIVEHGTRDILFEKILNCARRIEECEECFLSLESNTDLDNYGKRDVVQIYSTIRDICRIAIAYFQFDPEKRCKFNYYRVMVNL